MNQKPQRPVQRNSSTPKEAQGQISRTDNSQAEEAKEDEIDAKMVKYIHSLNGLQGYSIRILVKHTQDFGEFLKNNKLDTNQIRKFLDAMNRIKDKLIALESDEDMKSIVNDKDREKAMFSSVETEIFLLRPKLYYAARKEAAESFKYVISEAIDKIYNIADFSRLVELIEATVAYHTYYKQRGRN